MKRGAERAPHGSLKRPEGITPTSMWDPWWCVVCGDPTRLEVSSACSRECAIIVTQWKRRAHTIRRRFRTCLNCGVDYIKKRTNDGDQYCTRACAFEDQSTWHQRTLVKAPPKPARVLLEGLTCHYCGELFDERCGGERYCDDTCRAGKERERSNERYARVSQGRVNTKAKHVERTCGTCGKSYVAHPFSRYCTIRCRPSHGGGNGRKSRRRLRYLLVRDRGKCGLCGRRVHRKRKVPHPLAPVVDHIVPRSKGGGNERSNLQLAHHGCNSEKSAGARGSQLLLYG